MKPFEIFDPDKQYTGEEANDIVNHRFSKSYTTFIGFDGGVMNLKCSSVMFPTATSEMLSISRPAEEKPECDHTYSPIEIHEDVSHLTATQQTLRSPFPKWMRFCPKCSKDLR